MKTNCLINQSFLTLKASVPTAVSLITVLILSTDFETPCREVSTSSRVKAFGTRKGSPHDLFKRVSLC